MKTKNYYAFFLCLVGLFGFTFSQGQSLPTSQNWVKHSQLRISNASSSDASDPTHSKININYFDGLGRPNQTVGYRQSSQQYDVLLNWLEYDHYGRQHKSYLPMPTTANTGSNVSSNPLGVAQPFYGDSRPFAEITAYDGSPLNRPKESYSAGQSWYDAGKKVAQFYEVAEANEVRFYRLSGLSLSWDGFYPDHSVQKARTLDEQGHTRIVYTDRRNRKIREDVQDDTGYLTTVYVYDALDRLRAVIQPQGYELNQSLFYGSTAWTNWVFYYEYDNKNRLARKHVPGGGWTNYVYDKADRIVLEQSAQQTTQSKWSFTKYDLFGRVIIQGELSTSFDQSFLQSLFEQIEKPYEEWQPSSSIYTTQSYPISYYTTDEKLTNYYDQYSFIAGEWAFNSSIAYNPSSYWANATGLLTGGWVRDSENPSIVYHTVLYYDTKGRILQTFQTHPKGGSQRWTKPIITNYEYNFAGEVTKEKVLYQIDGQANTEALTWNEYDHVGRLLKIYHGINSTTTTEIIHLSYDEVGRLQQKKIMPNGTYVYGGIPDYIYRPPSPNVGIDDIAKKAICLQPGTEITNTYSATIDPNATTGTPISGLQTINYSWHIRGGLRGINLDASGNPMPNASQGDLFSFKLDYETAGMWDGNIGKQSWKNDTEGQRSYTYAYDQAKRLTSATYAGVNGEDFSLPQISYDKNGNIGYLARNGKTDSGYGAIDRLFYSYSGNRLQGVTDAISGNFDVGDFRDNGSNSDYTYWADGSLKSDANKGISLIEYDTFLKRVKQVTWSDGKWLKFFYDGSGKLLKRQNSAGDVWEYVGAMIFKNGQPYQLTTPEGRAVYASGEWNYEFEYRDVWNNLRVSFGAEGNQLVSKQASDYDAFGYEFNKVASTPNNYFKYQKQERIEDFGVGIDFFKYRPSDFIIGRFWQIDPLAEKFVYNSPYALQENKFGLGVELEGREVIPFPLWPAIAEGAVAVGEAAAATALGKAMIDAMKSLAKEPGAGQSAGNGNVPLWVQQRGKQMNSQQTNSTNSNNNNTDGEKDQNSNDKKSYSDPKKRPSYGKNQVEEVWDKAKQEDGNVYDPNTGEKLEWDKSKSRSGQWDMGHNPGKEYKKLHKDYLDGKIDKKEFLKQYRNPNNYQPESPSNNRSHKYENN